MTSWSAKRRFMYGGSVFLVLALIFGVVFWKIIYKVPTCSDGVKNGAVVALVKKSVLQRLWRLSLSGPKFSTSPAMFIVLWLTLKIQI